MIGLFKFASVVGIFSRAASKRSKTLVQAGIALWSRHDTKKETTKEIQRKRQRKRYKERDNERGTKKRGYGIVDETVFVRFFNGPSEEGNRFFKRSHFAAKCANRTGKSKQSIQVSFRTVHLTQSNFVTPQNHQHSILSESARSLHDLQSEGFVTSQGSKRGSNLSAWVR